MALQRLHISWKFLQTSSECMKPLRVIFFFLHLASVSCNPEPIRFVESHYASYNYSQALWLLLLEAMFVALDKT